MAGVVGGVMNNVRFRKTNQENEASANQESGGANNAHAC